MTRDCLGWDCFDTGLFWMGLFCHGTVMVWDCFDMGLFWFGTVSVGLFWWDCFGLGLFHTVATNHLHLVSILLYNILKFKFIILKHGTEVKGTGWLP